MYLQMSCFVQPTVQLSLYNDTKHIKAVNVHTGEEPEKSSFDWRMA